MKHFMLPKSGILRENITTTTEPSSPNPSSLKQRSSPSPRKHKFSKENTDPNGLHDPCSVSPSIAAKPPLSGGKSSRSHHLPPRPPNSIHNPLKRKLNMETNASDSSVSCSLDTGVKVIVRMRPPNKNEEEEEMVVQKVSSDSLSILGQTFTFDSVADTTSTQQEIFQVVGAPLVDNCLAGFNSSIFAYGQTGSGKTYTMWGPANALLERNSQQGLTPRVFEQLFARIQEEQVTHVDKELKYQCRCSFLEIYNEQITDLLDPTQRNLLIREDVKSGVYVENLTEELVCSMDDVTQILVKGFSNRKTGATSINAESSRSHSVFTCVVESRCKSASDGLSSVRISRINLVDLAGSERQKLTGTAGERLKEAGNINRSLSQLGNLINILAEVSQSGKQRHIPYRDSRLTFLLQESLGGNAKLAMICAISPAMSCKSETFSTLRFAQRAKTIKNKAIVNEVTRDDVNVLREVIRQLKEELLRMKENGNQSNSNGGYATSWNARRSLNLLKMSLNRPLTLPHAEEDSDEEMEIDEEDVERVCAEVERVCAQVGSQAPLSDKVVNDSKLGCSQSDSEFVPCDISNNMNNAISSSGDETVLRTMQLNDSSVVLCKNAIVSEKVDVNMEDQPNVVSEEAAVLDSQRRAENYDNQGCLIHTSADLLGASQGQETIQETLMISDCEIMDGKQESESLRGVSETVPVASIPDTSSSSCPNSLPSELSIIPADVSPVLKSPTPSVSPKIISSRKSLRTSTMVSASQKDLITGENYSGEEALRLSFAHPIKRNSLKASSSRTSKNCRTSTEHLAESLHHGLQIIDNHRQSSALGRSSFRFSCKPLDLKSVLPVEKVDVGVQTLSPKHGKSDEDPSGYVCGECKNRIIINELKETNENSNMQLVPTEVSPQSADKIKMQVPKAVEKVLAGAIRREMALEEFCNKKTTEISQLNRLIQQYKHERECNAILEQTREDKIIRLESLMDGVLPTEEFMEEELHSLTHEHKILKAKYDNHPEVLRTKIELKRVQDELDAYKNFFDMGERDVLIEEIQHLRSQLKYYTDSSSSISVHRSSLLKLTYSSEPSSAPLSTISESSEPSSEPLSTDSEFTEGSVEDKFEEERQRWTEVESKWISLCEELKIELDASRSLAGKLKQELDSEKKCSEELKEAMQMAMQGHARILEQYAELQESNIALHSRHRKMQEGIEDVKKAAAKAGVKGAESRFINSLAAEISALRAEREKERQYLMDKNKGLQAQLRDTAEAVQAAGELLVRLKEAEEAASIAQERASVAEKEAERAYRQVDSLKRKYEREESRLPKEAARPVYSDYSAVKYDVADSVSHGDEKWREEFEPFHGEDTEISKLSGASSWYSDYDRCNI